MSCRKDDGKPLHTRRPAMPRLLSLKLLYSRGTTRPLGCRCARSQQTAITVGGDADVFIGCVRFSCEKLATTVFTDNINCQLFFAQ